MDRLGRLLVVLVIGAGAKAVAAPMISPASPPGADAADGWSADPGRNLALADRARDQVQVKLAGRGNGGFYVSWYDDSAGGYDPTLQRLDDDGVEQWAHNGIVLADTSFAWTTDYALAVTADDEALVAFPDDREGAVRITMVRVAKDGAMVWGAGGIPVSEAAEPIGPPKIIATSDDQVVVAWTAVAGIHVRCTDLDARPVWPADVVFVDAADFQVLADLQATPDGGVIVSWVNSAAVNAARHLWAQKLDRDGRPAWGDVLPGGRRPLVVFDAGSLQCCDFPPFVPDGEGGAVFAWYETDPLLQVRVQHVLGDGTTRFPRNGALTTAREDPSVQRVEPAMAYDPLTRSIYVFWREHYESGPLDQWMRGQRFGADGARLWGDMGLEVEAHGAHEVTQLEAEVLQGGVLIAYVEKVAEGDQGVWIRHLDEEGASIWNQHRVAVSNHPSGKSRLDLAVSSSEFAALGWQDARAGSEDIYVQNVKSDGSLGPFEDQPTVEPTGTAPTPVPTTAPTDVPSPTATAIEPTGARNYLPAALRSSPIGRVGENVESFAVNVDGDRLYFADGYRLALADVANKARPKILARTVELGYGCRITDIAVSGDIAAVLCFRMDATADDPAPKGTVWTVDVRTPTMPRVLGSLPIDEMGWRMTAVGTWLYVGGWWQQFEPFEQRHGLVVADMSDPAKPRRHGFVELGMAPFDQWLDARRLTIVGGEGVEFDDGALRVVALEDPGAPTVLGALDPPLSTPGLSTVAVLDGIAYAFPFQGQSSLSVVDTAPADGPRLLATMHRADFAAVRDLAVAGDHLVALVERWDRSGTDIYVEVLRPPDRGAMADGELLAWLVGEVGLPKGSSWHLTANALAAAGEYVYVALGDELGVAIVDIRDPAVPSVVATLPGSD